MIPKRNHLIGPLGSLKISQHLIKWSLSSKMFGVTIDYKLTWSKHMSEFKRGFVKKLNLIKRGRFSPRNSLLDLYLKVILSSVTYALPIWGVVQTKTNLILWNQYIVGPPELYITSRATCLLRM